MAESGRSAWEYRLEADPSEADLASLGADGWELAAIDQRNGRFIFKRPAPALRERVTLDQKARVYATRAAQREAEA